MALINCSNCGKEISDKAEKCIHCGASTQIKNAKICSECGNEINEGDKCCQKCGCPIEEIENTIETSTSDINEEIKEQLPNETTEEEIIKINQNVENQIEEKQVQFKRKIDKKGLIVFIIYAVISFIGIIVVNDKFYENGELQFFSMVAIILLYFAILFGYIGLKKTKKKGVKFHWLYILSIISLVFFGFLTFAAYEDYDYEYVHTYDIRHIEYLDRYTNEEAKVLLENIYEATSIYDLSYIDKSGVRKNYCYTLTNLYPNDKGDIYNVEFYDRCNSGELDLQLITNEKDKTKVKRMYWQFNDSIQIPYYENGKKVDNYEYLYYSNIYDYKPDDTTMYAVEADIKNNLKAPSTAKFSYDNDGIRYNSEEKKFKYLGYVESQNSYGAMVRSDFIITMEPCEKEKCYYYRNYSWKFNEDNSTKQTTTPTPTPSVPTPSVTPTPTPTPSTPSPTPEPTPTYTITSIEGIGGSYKSTNSICTLDEFNASITKDYLYLKMDYNFKMTPTVNRYNTGNACRIVIKIYDSNGLMIKSYSDSIYDLTVGEQGYRKSYFYIDSTETNYRIVITET